MFLFVDVEYSPNISSLNYGTPCIDKRRIPEENIIIFIFRSEIVVVIFVIGFVNCVLLVSEFSKCFRPKIMIISVL